jgi:hypothetical protein
MSYFAQTYWLVRVGSHKKASPAEIHSKVAKVRYVDVLIL